MLRRSWISCLLVLAVIHCGRTDFEAKLILSIPRLVDGETSTYRVSARGDSVGTYTTSLRHAIVNEAPAYELTLITRTATGAVETIDSALVYTSRTDLTPLSSFRFVKTGSALFTTAANYSRRSVAVSAYASGEEKQKLLPYEPRTFDIDQLTFLGRALKFEPGKPVKINIINTMGPPLGGAVVGAAFVFKGDETITVPAGVFDCRKLVLRRPGGNVELWYETAPAKRLIRYRATGSGVTMELLPAQASGR